MYQNIYKKDHIENIKMFLDVKKRKDYSIYSGNLNRAFGDKSYNMFYKNLTENKTVSNYDFKKLFEKDEKEEKGLKRIDESFDTKKFEVALKKMKQKNDLYNEKLRNPYFERMKKNKDYLIKKELENSIFRGNKSIKPYFPNVPEVGRYNPDYDILDKHVYEVNFSQPSYYKKDKDNILNKSLSNEKDQNEENNKNYTGNDSFRGTKEYKGSISERKRGKRLVLKSDVYDHIKNMSNINLTDKLTKNISQVTSNEEKGNKTDRTFDKKNSPSNKKDINHCLKFESYTARKPLNKKIIYNTEINQELPNYYTPTYIHGNVDFNKVSSNNKIKSYFDEISTKNKNPPLGLYEPKFNTIMTKTRDIYLTKKDPPPPKQIEIKKIIYRYDVIRHYRIAPLLNEYTKENED